MLNSGVKTLFQDLCQYALGACVQREQMFTFEITFLPASLPSLATSYQRVRMAVGYPDGGVSNGMAVAFLPGAVMDAGDVSVSRENATASWSIPAAPRLTRPSNDALAFLTVCHRSPGDLIVHVSSHHTGVLKHH